MSKIFNLSHLMNMQTPDLVKSVFPKTFLSEAINIVESYDSATLDIKRNLYQSLLEAESTKDENSTFAQYFKEFKEVLYSHMRKARELSSKFNINIDTFVDANKDLFDSAKPECLECLGTATYNGKEFSNLLKDDIPNIDPYKAFKCEFAMLGKLLQDLGPITSEEQKAAVIATVCNNLGKKLNDGWLKKCTEKIADCDDCKNDEFAQVMYNQFVKGDTTLTVDIGLVQQSKLALMNYSQYVQVIDKAVDNLCEGLEKIGEEIGSMFFRNQDHKFNLETDEDGVENKVYHFNEYGFNQLNRFLATKVSQISELFNLYMIALSIKMDCISKYLYQCKDIIELATGANNTEPADVNTDGTTSEEEPEDTSIEPEESDSAEEPEEVDEPEVEEPAPEAPETDGEAPEEPIAEETPEVDDDTSDEEIEDATEDLEDVANDDPTDSEAPADESAMDDFEDAAYLFEAELHMINRMNNYYSFNDEVYTMLGEADAPANPADKTKKSSLKTRVQLLVNKFKSTFTKDYSKRIKFVLDNSDLVKKAQIPEGWTIQKMDVSKLLSFKMPRYNANETFEDEDAYVNAKYGRYMAAKDADNVSFKERMLANNVLSKDEAPYGNAERANGLNWIIRDYKTAMKVIQDACEVYNNFCASIGIKESSTVTTEDVIQQYLSEDNSGSNKEDGKPNDKALISIYMNVNASMLAALANIFSMKTKKELKFLEKLAIANGAKKGVV